MAAKINWHRYGTKLRHCHLCRCLLFRITVGVVRVTVWVKCRVMLSWSLRKNEETRLEAFEIKGVNRFCGFRGQLRKQMSGFLTSRSKEGTDRHRQSKETRGNKGVAWRKR